MRITNGNLIELTCNICEKKAHSHKDNTDEKLYGWVYMGNYCLCPECLKEEKEEEE